MIGALIGDYVSSTEAIPTGAGNGISDLLLCEQRNRCSFHSVRLAATTHALIHGLPYADSLEQFTATHSDSIRPSDLYSLQSRDTDYWELSEDGSAAIRAIPLGLMKHMPLEWVVDQATVSAACTHSTRRAIESAQAVSLTLHMLLNGQENAIKRELHRRFGYLIDIRHSFIHTKPSYPFKASYSVPAAISIGMKAAGFENALRIVAHTGGDVATMSIIAGEVAARRFDVVDSYKNLTLEYLSNHASELLRTFDEFRNCSAQPYEKALRPLPDLGGLDPDDSSSSDYRRSALHLLGQDVRREGVASLKSRNTYH